MDVRSRPVTPRMRRKEWREREGTINSPARKHRRLGADAALNNDAGAQLVAGAACLWRARESAAERRTPRGCRLLGGLGRGRRGGGGFEGEVGEEGLGDAFDAGAGEGAGGVDGLGR